MLKKIGVVVVLFFALIGLLASGLFVYSRFFVGEAPDPFSLTTPSPSVTGVDNQPFVLAGTWSVLRGEGGYRVREVLLGKNNNVAGRTSDVTGTLTVEGDALVSGSVTVALKDVETDDPARDVFFRGHLDLGDFPDATFTFNSLIDISGIADGPLTLQVPGALTLHGTTKNVVAEIQAQRDGQDVEVVATIALDFTDYGVGAVRLEDFAIVDSNATIEAQITFALKR